MAVVIGSCPRSFPDDKTGKTINGYAFRIAVDWSSSDGEGFDTDKLFVRSDTPDDMQRVLRYRSYYAEKCPVKLIYNRFGKIIDLEAI